MDLHMDWKKKKKNLPSNAEDMGSVPHPGRFPHATGQLSWCAASTESVL